MAWLNLTIPNQTVKNGLKAKKIKFPEMNFFLEKQLIKFSCTYWLLSFCKILKDFFGPIQNYKVVPFSSPKWPICHGQDFFGTNHYYYFHLSFVPFHRTKFKKKLQRTQSYKDAPFLGPKWSICAKQIFFGKLLKSFSSTYWSLLFCKILKKLFQRIQSYQDPQLLGTK